MKCFSLIDRCILQTDRALKAICGPTPNTGRASPANTFAEYSHTTDERKQVAAFFRINHAGEIAAQGLYHGQAMTARLQNVKIQMENAATEEGDHLMWCQQRLDELGSYRSYLTPLWYAGSFCIGAAAGLASDTWSLSFVAETEKQVSAHLQQHRDQLPAGDLKSHALLKTMQEDEQRHAETAIAAGAQTLPNIIQYAMSTTARIMTSVCYWV